MSTDVMGSYVNMAEYLEGEGYRIKLDGAYMNIVDVGINEVVAVMDTIEEVGRWIQDEFGVNLIKEDVCTRTISKLTPRVT